MGVMPDGGIGPGDALPAQPAQDDLLNAYSAGYTHDDITAMGADPTRPDIGEIWGGTHPADATWGDAASAGPEQYSRWDAPTTEAMSQPGRDAIDASAGPIGELLIGAASGGAAGAIKDLPAAVAGTLKSTSGELAPGAADTFAGWLHGSDTQLSADMMKNGRSLWLTQNPAVAKNVGNFVHDVELRPGVIKDVTAEITGSDVLSQQRSMYDLAAKYQWDNPTGAKYLSWPGGNAMVALNQRSAVLAIGRKR